MSKTDKKTQPNETLQNNKVSMICENIEYMNKPLMLIL